jgi:multiple sugar transport system substrate-binding protein
MVPRQDDGAGLMSRRRLLRAGVFAGAGAAGLAALAGCGETQIVEVIKEVPVEKVVETVKEVPVERVKVETVERVKIQTVIVEKPAVQRVTVLDWVHPLSAEDMAVFQPLIDRFNRDVNPNIEIRIDIVPWSNRIQKTMGAVAAGAPPDTAYVNVDEFTTYVVQDVLEPLDEFVKKDNVDLDDWLPGPRSGMDWEGKIYELPHLYAFRVAYFNKTVWEKSGLDPAKTPTTWTEHSEMLTQVMAAKAAGSHNAYGTAQAGLGHPVTYWNPYFYQAGGSLLTEDGKSGYNSAAGLEAADKILEVMENFADPADRGSNGREHRPGFGQGNYAYRHNDELGLARTIEKDYPDLNFGVAETMTGKVKWTHGGLGCKCIFAGSKYKDATWEWIQFMAGEGNLEYNIEFGYVPPRQSNLDLYVKHPDVAGNPVKIRALEEAKFGRVEKAPGLWDMWDVLKPAMQAFALGEKTPKEALDEAADKINKDILGKYRGAQTG